MIAVAVLFAASAPARWASGGSLTSELVWEAQWSKGPVTAPGAGAYCTALGKGWRLPTRRELEALLEPTPPGGARPAAPFRKGGPRLPQTGYLWSGEEVDATRAGQHWIMNLANGHIFNGAGETGYAKCVRSGAPITGASISLPAGYAFLGPRTARLTVLVAMETDLFWFMVRPTLDRLLRAHPIRFEVHAYVIRKDDYQAAALALCAAARAGRFGALERRLLSAGARGPRDAATMRRLALAAGVKGADYDRGVTSECPALLASDKAALGYRGVDSTPTFIVGSTMLRGVIPYETLDAAIRTALGQAGPKP